MSWISVVVFDVDDDVDDDSDDEYDRVDDDGDDLLNVGLSTC